MANTSTLQPNPTPPEITFYTLGVRAPSGCFPKSFMDNAIATAEKSFGNLVPTTYEASKAYLDEELLKPEGQRNLLREMCMIIVVNIPNDQKVSVINHSAKLIIPLYEGATLVMPTIEYPPTSFGTPENQTSSKLVNMKSTNSKRLAARATIILSYFTRTQPDYVGDTTNATRLNCTPYR